MNLKIEKKTTRLISWEKRSNFDKIDINIGEYKFYIYGVNNYMKGKINEYFKNNIDFYHKNVIKFFNELYSVIPGHYYIVDLSKDHVKVITDVYALLKLYLYETNNFYFVTDNHKDCLEFDNAFTINKNVLKYFFITNYTPSGHTIFNELKKLPPATITFFTKVGVNSESYLILDNKKSFDGEELVLEIYKDLDYVIDFYKNKFSEYNLFLSGGLDSSFLLKFLLDKGVSKDVLKVFTGKNIGLNQTFTTSNDYDILYSKKLAEQYNVKHNILKYDFTNGNILDDFRFLNNNLFNEYAPALAYVGFINQIVGEGIIYNGQNADSVFSFGGMGFPHFNKIRLVGLSGIFTRYIHFFQGSKKNKPLYFLSNTLKYIYYKKNYNIKQKFSYNDFLLGIALNPRNYPYWENDPVFSNIKNINSLAKWMTDNYLNPLLKKYPNLNFHGLAQILYHNTYMQGSANRSTVYPPLLKNKNIILPYAHLPLLEKMILLKPSWKYVYYGKYPNLAIGKRTLNIPKYIIKRDDPPGCDDIFLIYKSLLKNNNFADFLFESINMTNWGVYDDVLSEDIIFKIKNSMFSKDPKVLPFLMKFVWINNIINEFL